MRYIRLTQLSFKAFTGHILLMSPVSDLSSLISLKVILFRSSFLARNAGCGRMRRVPFSVNLHNSVSLTHACSSLTLHPVASKIRNAAFLIFIISECNSDSLSRKSKTVLNFHPGAVTVDFGLCRFIPRSS